MSVIRRVGSVLLLTAAANCALLSVLLSLTPVPTVLVCIASAAALLLIAAFPARADTPVLRLKILRKGQELLLLFSATFMFNLAVNVVFGVLFVPDTVRWWLLAVNAAVCLLSGLVLLLFALSRAFLASLQLGVKWRVLLFFFWWVPAVNIYLLWKAYRLIRNEYEFERTKDELNRTRKESEICKTKYPLLLVHGVFFRDFRYFSYWGRIPKELVKNGAVIYLGNQQSAASVRESARELAGRIGQLVAETGCEKINVIAHSKGGLDARYAVSRLGMDKYVASLTTVNTPHRGCVFADRLLEKAPDKLKNGIAKKYNAALKRLGDPEPDFIAAVTDLTASRCKAFNEETPDSAQVYYQSVASCLSGWTGGRFPLNLSHLYVRPHDGDNDGLVSVESARWGSACRLIAPTGPRGVSHGDVIDLNRENIDGFDVRELYVDIVGGLRAMGV